MTMTMTMAMTGSMTMTMSMTMAMAMTVSMTGFRGTSSQAPCPGLGPTEERASFSRVSHVAVRYRDVSCDRVTRNLYMNR